jgi:IS30 family transposase
VGIEYRSAIVDKKMWFEDWKADAVLGKQGIGSMVSLVKRKNKLYLILKVPRMLAELWSICCGSTLATFALLQRATAMCSVTMNWLLQS